MSPTETGAALVAEHSPSHTGGARPQVVTDENRDHYDDTSSQPLDRHSVLAREREEHGGIKIGSAFFGWLTAMGMAAS